MFRSPGSPSVIQRAIIGRMTARRSLCGIASLLALSGCTPAAHTGIHPLLFSKVGTDGQPIFQPPPYPFDVEAETQLPARCINHILASELLNRNGSPTVPVGVNGEEGAAFISPSEDAIGVFEGNDENLDLPNIEQIGAMTVSGAQNTWMTRIRQLIFAQGHVERVSAMKLGEIEEPKNVQMSAIAILGFDILGNYDVLLDMPARRLTLFKETNAPGCPDLSASFDAPVYRAPILPGRTGLDNMVSVTLDGAHVGMHLEPSANLSVISETDALADGLTRTELYEGDRVNTINGRTLVGYRHSYRDIEIGDWHGGKFSVNVEPVEYNLLGRDFFRHRKVLMAFPTGMMFFGNELSDSGPRDIGPGNLSPVSSHIAHTETSH